MKIKELFMTLPLILVVLMSGCKKDDYKATVGVCPIVVSTIPVNGAVGVPLNQVISATFNEKMNAATITSSSFTVIDATKSPAVVITGAIAYSGMTAFLTPSSPLLPNTTYTGRVTTAARDLMGNALQTDYVWTFSTDSRPTVTSNPPDKAVDVPLGKIVVLTFNVPMDTLSLKSPASNITINQGLVPVPGKFNYTLLTATFTPTSNLAPFTVYTGTVSKSVKNALGTPMAADYVFSFTTIPQLSLSSNPVLGGTTSGSGTFAQGSTVTAVATANTGFSFLNWTDGANVVSTNASYQFAMAGNKSLVANFTPKFVVNVLSNPLLGGTTTGGGTFVSGTSVTVNAVPNIGFSFTNWKEGANIVSSSAVYVFNIAGSRTLTANYTPIPYTVSVSSNPLLGGTTIGGGIFNAGSSVMVTATPNIGYTFTNWTEGSNIVSTIAVYPFTITGNRTLVANYANIPYTVTTISNPLLGGSTIGDGTYNSGTLVTVVARPSPIFTFRNWTEGVNIVSTNDIYAFTIAGNRILTANYNAIPFTVAVSSNPLLGGTTTGGGVFNSGSSVTVTAIPNVGFTFTNWMEGIDIVSSSAIYQFTLTGNTTLVAKYTAIPYTIAVSSLPVLGGTTTGGGIFNSGAPVTVHAVTNPGFTFTNWTEGINIVSTDANYLFTIAGDRTLVANYNAIPFTVAVSSNPLIGGITGGGGIFNSGTLVTVTAAPNVGYTFTNWTEGLVVVSANANYQFAISGNRILVANYAPITYTIGVSSNPLNGGTTSGGGTFNSGASVIVKAISNGGYTFTSWTEGVNIVSTSNTYNFLVTKNRNLVANFANDFILNVTAVNGTVVRNPNSSTYSNGTSVQLTAIPSFGYSFTSWSGDATGIVNPVTIIMNSNKAVTANFTLLGPFGPGVVDLKTAGNFVILTKSGITNVFQSAITGNIGTKPITGASITGLSCPEVTGTIYTVDAAGPACRVVDFPLLSTAVSDMEAAYTAANLLVVAPIVNYSAGVLNGQTLAPGLYKWTTDVSITTGITLSGGADDTWVFQIAGELNVNTSAVITLLGGAQAKNIVWVVAGSKANLEAGVDFSGIILSQFKITLNTGAKVNGRLLAQTEVTLIKNTVVEP